MVSISFFSENKNEFIIEAQTIKSISKSVLVLNNTNISNLTSLTFKYRSYLIGIDFYYNLKLSLFLTFVIKIPFFFWPHQPVVKKSNNKLRIVYDAYAKLTKSSNSLNECLHLEFLSLQNLTEILFSQYQKSIPANLFK